MKMFSGLLYTIILNKQVSLKLLCLFYLGILNKYSEKISRDVKEIKLYLVSQIRNQIKKLVNQFKPILSWRILVEK